MMNSKKFYSSILIFLLLISDFSDAFASTIDNELTGDPVVDCEDTMVSLTFKTKKPFTGRVYVQGLADDDRCARNFAANSDQSKFSMMIQNGDCTMQRQRVTGSLEGIMLSLTIVVSFHGTFVTKADRAYRCMCFFRNIKRLSNSIDMSPLGTTELLDTAKMPTCSYSIHSDSPDGPISTGGKIGDKIYHVWQCEDSAQGFLVHSCFVDDGKGARFDLLDIDGCAIDPIIQPDVAYDSTLSKAFVETFGYKFSDTSVLNYQCVVELCKKEAGECDGLTPPKCGRTKRSIGSRRQNEHKLSNEMEVSTTMEIMDRIPEKDVTENNLPLALPQFSSLKPSETQDCFFPVFVGLTVTILSSATFTAVAYIFTRKSKILQITPA